MTQPPETVLLPLRGDRSLNGLARSMGLLGRFQIVASVVVFLLLLGLAGVLTAAELLEPATRTAEHGTPIVSLGEVSRPQLAVGVSVAIAFILLFFRGGAHLLGAAEELEALTAGEGRGDELLLSMGRLRRYFMLEALLFAALLGLAYFTAIIPWAS